MIKGINEMHISEINIKNITCQCYSDNLVKAKKLENKNILINVKKYKDLVILFTRYVQKKSIKMLNLHYHELIGKIEEHEQKKYLMVVVYMLNKDKIRQDQIRLDKIKELKGIEKFDDTKILIDTNDKLPDNIILKNVIKFMKCVVKDDGKFYPQRFLEEALYV